jgi:hypothetical protein
MGVLAVVILGLIAGAEVASNGNAYSRRRSVMLEFAQSRIELLLAMTRNKVPTATTTYPVSCSAMAVPSGTFDPTAPPGTGGWMLDVIDGSPPTGSTALGDDLMFGPLLIEGDRVAVDRNSTLSQRATFAANWLSGTDTAGCGSSVVTSNPAALCREIHIEPYDTVQNGVTTYMLRAWVRVVRGGPNWAGSQVTLTADLSQ